MSTKHTPGPWEAEFREQYKPDSFLETYLEKITILGPVKEDGWQTVIANVLFNPDEPTARANALVMAAAPELLDAARAAITVICGKQKLSPDELSAMDILSRAIAKATGDSTPD